MPTASDLLLNLSIQVEGEEGLKTLGDELKALEAEQFKYNKQAQQGTVITEKVEAATRENKKEFQRIRAEIGKQILSNKHSEETVQDLNKAHGLLSDQIRMAQSTIMKYGQETIQASEKQQEFANTSKALRSRLQAIKDRTSDLQRSLKGSSEATSAQALEFKRVSDRAKELERDAEKLTKKFGNNREETNAYRKVLVDVKSVQDKLNNTFRQSNSDFSRLSGEISGINKEVNRLRNEFFESDLRAKELESSTMTLAEANEEVDKQNKRNIETMKTQRQMLRELRNEVDVLTKSNTLSAAESEKLSKQLNSATQNAGTSQRTLQDLNGTFGTSTQVQNRATQALISFSQGLQDAPQFAFGFSAGVRAIANNMTQFKQLTSLLGQSIEQTTGETATFGQKLKALFAALKGPAGGLLLVTAITTAITFFTARMSKAKKEAEGLSTSIDDLTSTLTGYQSTLGSDEFGVDNLMLQKEALEDIQSSYQQQLKTFEKISEESDVLDKTLERVGTGAQKTLKFLTDLAGLPGVELAPIKITQEQFEDLGFSEEEARRFEKFTIEQQTGVLALRESRRALEEQARQVGVSVDEFDELETKVTQLNNQIEINNRLASLRPLGERIQELNKQASILQIRSDFGEISVEQAQREMDAMKEERRSAKEALETALARQSVIEQISEAEERFAPPLISPIHTGVVKNLNQEYGNTVDVLDPLSSITDRYNQRVLDLGLGFGVLLSPINNAKTSVAELTSTQADNKAIIDETTAIIEIFEQVLSSANDERQRELELEREKQMLTVDTQTKLALSFARQIEDEREKATTIFNVEKAALDRRTALRQGVAVQDIEHDEQYTNQLVDLRIRLNQRLRQIDQQNADEQAENAEQQAQREEELAKRRAQANHQIKMLEIKQNKDGMAQIDALEKEELRFLKQRLDDELIIREEYELARKQMEERYANLREQNRKNEDQAVFNSLQMGLQQVGQVFGALNQLSNTRAQVSEAAARREFEVQKKLSYASAVVNAAAAAVGVLRDQKGDAVTRIIGMSTVLAAAAIQIATIRKQHRMLSLAES